MDNIQITLHAVNGMMFLFALYVHARGYFEVKSCVSTEIIKRLGKNVMLAGSGLALLFLLLQADWVISNHNADVGGSTAWAWLLFDYGLALYLLIMGTLVRVFSQWRGSAPKKPKR